MSILLDTLPQKRFYSKYFTLSFITLSDNALLYMRMNGEIVNTCEIPETISILQLHLPSIFKSTCFNKKGLSFKKEVRRTEIGHLLEHIILEYLCIAKKSTCREDIVYSGVTFWDWSKDAFGTFHITIDAKSDDKALFEESLERGILLLNQIIKTTDQRSEWEDKSMQTESRNLLLAYES